MSVLAELWHAWDEHPSWKDETNALEDRVQIVSKRMDMTGTELRKEITALRIAGMTIDEAVEEAAWGDDE